MEKRFLDIPCLHNVITLGPCTRVGGDVKAVLLWYMCGNQDGASPRGTQMQLTCQETGEIRAAIRAAFINMLKLKNTEGKKTTNQPVKLRGREVGQTHMQQETNSENTQAVGNNIVDVRSNCIGKGFKFITV